MGVALVTSMNTNTQKKLDAVAELVRDNGGELGEWTRSKWGFYAVCSCCGGLAAVTITRIELRELPHCCRVGRKDRAL